MKTKSRSIWILFCLAVTIMLIMEYAVREIHDGDIIKTFLTPLVKYWVIVWQLFVGLMIWSKVSDTALKSQPNADPTESTNNEEETQI